MNSRGSLGSYVLEAAASALHRAAASQEPEDGIPVLPAFLLEDAKRGAVPRQGSPSLPSP